MVLAGRCVLCPAAQTKGTSASGSRQKACNGQAWSRDLLRELISLLGHKNPVST